MIAHVLLFRLRVELSPTDQQALVEAYATALEEIPSIRRARVGRRVRVGRPYEALTRPDFPFTAILEFDDLDGVEAYLDHPAHAEIATRFFAATDDVLVFDFKMEEDPRSLQHQVG